MLGVGSEEEGVCEVDVGDVYFVLDDWVYEYCSCSDCGIGCGIVE